MSSKKTHQQFVNEMMTLNPRIEILDYYNGSRTPIKVRCRDCGHIWEAAPTNLLRKRGCPQCSYQKRGENRRKTEKEFYREITLKNPYVETLGSYTLSSKKLRVRCRICNHEWMASPSSLLRGSGCPRCSHTGTSFAEQVFLLTLQKLCPFQVLSRDRSAIGIELDIYIPSLKFAFEYGAWPWHKEKKDRDTTKFRLCQEKGIQLIEIFDAYDEEVPDNENIWVYRENIGKKENSKVVKDITIRICNTLNIPFTLSDDEFNLLQTKARQNSRTMTTERLNEILTNMGSDAFVLSEYEDSLSKVLAQCRECEYQWRVTPASLLRGSGCPICSRNKRKEKLQKTTEQFVEELKKSNTFVEVIGDYKGNHHNIEVKCIKHGITWISTPGSLLRGSGCPQCRKEQISYKRRKSAETFRKEVYSVNPNIELLQSYVNQKTKIKVKCNICLSEFTTWPDVLLRGGGCPVCARKHQIEKRRKTDEEFRSELSKINQSITLLDVYKSSKEKVQVKCLLCGYEWAVIPTSLLQGSSCPNCKGRRKTQEEFITEMMNTKPHISVKGSYINAKTTILVACKHCGFEWMSSPTNLLRKDRIMRCKQCGMLFGN